MNKDFNWQSWSGELDKHIKAIQEEAVSEYRQQLLKAVEEMKAEEKSAPPEGAAEELYEWAYLRALDRVAELLNEKGDV